MRLFPKWTRKRRQRANAEDNQALAFPKPVRTKKEKRPDRLEFQIAVPKLDGRCMNPFCERPHRPIEQLHGHHIIPSSFKIWDEVENGLTFCIECHPKYPHEGFTRPGGKARVTGRLFVLMCLAAAKERSPADYRWDRAEAMLLQRGHGL